MMSRQTTALSNGSRTTAAAIAAVLVLWSLTAVSTTTAFAPLPSSRAVLETCQTNTRLFGLLGRFRNKREVEQVVTIQPGSKLPSIDVEKLVLSKDGSSFTSQAASIQEVLGNSKALLVGT
jgi:hypothetical protein